MVASASGETWATENEDSTISVSRDHAAESETSALTNPENRDHARQGADRITLCARVCVEQLDGHAGRKRADTQAVDKSINPSDCDEESCRGRVKRGLGSRVARKDGSGHRGCQADTNCLQLFVSVLRRNYPIEHTHRCSRSTTSADPSDRPIGHILYLSCCPLRSNH